MHASPTKARGVRPLQPSLKASTCGSREAHTNKQTMRDGQPYLVSQGVEDGHRVRTILLSWGAQQHGIGRWRAVQARQSRAPSEGCARRA